MAENERQDLSIWTIYDHPLDFPDSFVARRHLVGRGESKPTDSFISAKRLDLLREVLEIQMGLVCLPRVPSDDPVIVESWV